MSNEPITWDNIPGLSDEERRLAKMAFAVDDLRHVVLKGNVVNGVLLPDVVNGVVER